MCCASLKKSIHLRIIALFCLGAFLCGASGIVPALTLVAGQLDDDHQVVVVSSRNKVEIRFHHGHEDAPASDMGAGTAIADSGNNSPEDHVVEFISAGDSLARLPSLASTDHTLIPVAVVATERFASASRPFIANSQARPPPGEATWSRCLRSVVLLV